jgi:1-acyl-sn-glycerol-3-phosphate acyltransferase
MNKFFHILYTVWALLIFHVFMIILLPFFIIPPLLYKRGIVLSWKAIRLWSLLFSFFNRITYKVEGSEVLEKKKNYVFVVNHTSFLDTPALPQAIDLPFRALAKKELTKIPLFGIIIKMVTEVVDRSSGASRQKSKDRLNKVLAEESSILVFPEGTMNRTGALLQSFYDGAFRIAIDAKASMVPVVVIGAAKLMKPGSFLMKPGTVRVKVLPPIDASAYTQKQLLELKNLVRSQMEEELRKGV